MPTKTSIFWMYTVFLICDIGHLYANWTPKVDYVEDGVEFHITPEGFQQMSDSVTRVLQEDYQKIHLDQHTIKLLKVIGIHFNNTQIEPRVNSFQLQPDAERLKFNLDMESLALNVAEIQITNPFLPHVTINCMDTDIYIEEKAGTLVDGTLNVSLEQKNKVQLSIEELNGKIERDAYHSDGPMLCTGFLGERNVVLESIGRIVTRSMRSFALPMVKSSLKRNEDIFSEWVNAQLPLQHNMRIPHFVLTPETKLHYKFDLTAVKIHPEGMTLTSGVKVDGVHSSQLPPITSQPHEDKKPHDTSAKGPSLLKFMANPEIINISLAKVYSSPETEFELSPSLHIGFADLFSRKELREIWPAIDTIPSSVDYLRAFVSIPTPPRIANGKENSQEMNIEIPELKFRFQIYDTYGWRNFFILKLRIQATTQLTFDEFGDLNVVIKEPKLGVEGNWPVDFFPKDPTFRQDYMEETLNILAQFQAMENSPVHIKIPQLEHKRKHFYFNEFWSKGEYFMLEMSQILQRTLP